jgi:hypothetical protein
MIEPLFIERMLTGGFLASLAVGIAFGPELRRVFLRMRNRRTGDVPAAASIGVEPQQS